MTDRTVAILVAPKSDGRSFWAFFTGFPDVSCTSRLHLRAPCRVQEEARNVLREALR